MIASNGADCGVLKGYPLAPTRLTDLQCRVPNTSCMASTASAGCEGEQVPQVGDPLELMLAAIVEAEPRAGDEVLERPRDEHLTGAGER